MTAVIAALSLAVLAASPSDSTTAPLTVYVATTGNDANACTQVAKPCLTIQRALDVIPKHPSHPVTVSVGVGAFKGALIEGFQFQKAQAYLQILGTYVTATLATGITSGTFTSTTAGAGITWATGTRTGAGWTVDNLRGKLVRITSGSTVGLMQVAVISRNTADTITLVGPWPRGNPGAVNFEIVDWGTRINVGVQRPDYAIGGAAAGDYGFYLSGMTGVALASANQVGLDALAFDTLSSAGIYHASNVGVQIRHMRFTGYGTTFSFGVFVGSASGGLSVYSSVFEGTDPNVVAIQSNGIFTNIFNSLFHGSFSSGLLLSGPSSGGASGFVNSNEFTTSLGANSVAINLDSATRTSVFYCKVYGPLVGIGARSGGQQVISSSQIDSTTTAVAANKGAYVDLGIVLGTSNTTVLSASNGATIYLDSSSTITGTTEISVDGTTYTIAAMRAATPKAVPTTASPMGSKVIGN